MRGKTLLLLENPLDEIRNLNFQFSTFNSQLCLSREDGKPDSVLPAQISKKFDSGEPQSILVMIFSHNYPAFDAGCP